MALHRHRVGAGSRQGLVVAGALAALWLASSACAQSDTAKPDSPKLDTPKAKPAAGSASPKATAPAHSRYRPDRFAGRAGEYYRMIWGVDSLTVKWTESGEMIRFSYRALDPDKAKALNDKRSEPSLVDPRAGVSLVVPSMEQVGALRQSADPESGKSYWMAFSNKGRLVKRGDRVNVVIGQFHADGLVVD
jgi:hypothetical protein